MAEAGEGLIESRAGGGLELAVRVVNDRTSFVSLPRDVLASLTARSPALPLPLALTPVERRLKRRGETAGPTKPKPAFVAWAGAASDGFGVVDVPAPSFCGVSDAPPLAPVFAATSSFADGRSPKSPIPPGDMARGARRRRPDRPGPSRCRAVAEWRRAIDARSEPPRRK